MRSLLALTVYCISLLSFQQLLALPVENRIERSRLDLLETLSRQREEDTVTPLETESDVASSPTDTMPSLALDRAPKWLPGFLRRTPPADVRRASPGLAWARPSAEGSEIPQRRVQRSRRHAHNGLRGGHHHHPHHTQLLRVGCVLGTCQVQNLSHRLYQLIGQSGREDSSPINPRSPHSYG